MCQDCHEGYGSPTELPPTDEYDEWAALVRELYAEHPTGGPLHVVLDDWNLEDRWLKPYLFGDETTETVERAERIAALMRGWRLDVRSAAMRHLWT